MLPATAPKKVGEFFFSGKHKSTKGMDSWKGRGVRTELGLGQQRCNNEKRVLLTGYAEIVRLAERRSLRLELCLDNVERTGRDTRGETTASASCEGVIGERLGVVGGIRPE